MHQKEGTLGLTESEVRSIVHGELRRIISERAGMGGLELSMLVGDAMLDGLREIVVSAARNSDVQLAAKSAGQVDPRHLAEKIVGMVLNDQDFRTDLIGLVIAMIKRASK